MSLFKKNQCKGGACKKQTNRRLSVLTKLFNRFSKSRFTQNMRHFLLRNKELFPVSEGARDRHASVVLTEVNSFASGYIAYSYLTNILAKKHKARIVGYIGRQLRPFTWIKVHIRKMLNVYPYSVYRSFGVREFIYVRTNRGQVDQVEEVYRSIVKNLETKRDIENIEIKGILVGDLIYDSCLRDFRVPTIDPKAENFLKHLRSAIETFFYWEAYFQQHKVCAVLVSHSVYIGAILARLAIQKNIAVYETHIQFCYYLNQDHPLPYKEHAFFPEEFSQLSNDVKNKGLQEAKARLKKRFSGEKDIDMVWVSSSAYGQDLYKDTRIIRESDKPKVLIFAHCFFDAPHFWGENIFPDFYEWLVFLGEMSEKTDYDWYLKTHPDELPGSVKVIDDLLQRYPKITLIPSNSSHHQVIAEGVSTVLTIYGTVGFEYAALGIPVINCSNNNPHIRYDFNLHPANVDEYTQAIMGIKDIKLNIDIDKVYEYYYMKNIYYGNQDIFLDYHRVLERMGGYHNQFTPRIYEYWNNEFSMDKHSLIMQSLSEFVDSKAYSTCGPRSAP